MPTVPDSLQSAILRHLESRRDSITWDRDTPRRTVAKVKAAHAEYCHRFHCLTHAIRTGVQPVSAGWDALSLGYVPEDWTLPATFPGACKA